MSRACISLRGQHNLMNVLAACSIGAAAGLPGEAMRAGVEGFTGVPHRLEFIRSWGGADWYNDSIATAPERSLAAIQSFDEPLMLLREGEIKTSLGMNLQPVSWSEWTTSSCLVRLHV
jgi:UDP-N-acetylmuramoylalanine--D-glutamate ligase